MNSRDPYCALLSFETIFILRNRNDPERLSPLIWVDEVTLYRPIHEIKICRL